MTAPVRDLTTATPFSLWLREQEGLDSIAHSMNISDIDQTFIVEKYETAARGLSARWLKLCLLLEVKTFNAEPPLAQQELLWIHHQRLSTSGKTVHVRSLYPPHDVQLKHYGVFVLRLPGARPDDAPIVSWGRFNADGAIEYTDGSSAGVVSLLSFERDPRNLNKNRWRRHHGEDQDVITRKVKTDMGYETEEIIARRY